MPDVNEDRLRSMLTSMVDEIEPADRWERVRGALTSAVDTRTDVQLMGEPSYVGDPTDVARSRRRRMSILVAVAAVMVLIAVAIAAQRNSKSASTPIIETAGDGTMPFYVPTWLPNGLTLDSASHGTGVESPVDGWTVMLDRDDGSGGVTITSQADIAAGSSNGVTTDPRVIQTIGICDGLTTVVVRNATGCFQRPAAGLSTLTVVDGTRMLTLGAVGKIDDETVVAIANSVVWSVATGYSFTVNAADFTQRFAGPLSAVRPIDMWLSHYQRSDGTPLDPEKPWLSFRNLTISVIQRNQATTSGNVTKAGDPIDINGIAARLIVMNPQQDGAPQNYSVNWEMRRGVSVAVSGFNLSRDQVVRVARALRQVSHDEWTREVGGALTEQGTAPPTAVESGSVGTTAATVRPATQAVTTDGPSQSPRDAARDHVVPAVAALPMSKRIKHFGANGGASNDGTRFVAPEGVWMISRLADDVDPEGGSGVLGDQSGTYGTDFIAPAEYGELLFLDPTGSSIIKAYPFPGQPPSQLLVTSDAVYCAHVGDGALPSSMLCRVDRTTAEEVVRVFHCDAPDCGAPSDETLLPGWVLDGQATIHGRLSVIGERLESSDDAGSSSFSATTLALIESNGSSTS